MPAMNELGKRLRVRAPSLRVLGNDKMLQAEGAKAPVKVEFDNFEHGFPEGFGRGAWGHLAYCHRHPVRGVSAVCRGLNYLPSQVVRGIHVGFLILMTLA